MFKINEEKFLADYEAKVAERDALIANKEAALAQAQEQAEQVVIANNYNETVKATLIAAVIAQKEAEFNVEALDAEIAKFEEYLIEEIEEVESAENVEGAPAEEQPCDAPVADAPAVDAPIA